MINTHFQQRKQDDEELEMLKVQIQERHEKRQEQTRIRKQREEERVQRVLDRKKKKEQEAEKKRLEEEEKRKKAIANIAMNKMDYLGRYSKNRSKSGKQTNREKKKKILSE